MYYKEDGEHLIYKNKEIATVLDRKACRHLVTDANLHKSVLHRLLFNECWETKSIKEWEKILNFKFLESVDVEFCTITELMHLASRKRVQYAV